MIGEISMAQPVNALTRLEQDKILQKNFAADYHRPQYHFLPPANWLNDPNGVIQWQGQYHIFYQYNPNGPFWGTIHWGHAVSTDLVHWEHLPIALTPDPGTVDADGCWSGYIVNDDGVPTLIYTGLRNRVQLPCLATSPDNLVTWQKYDGNPIIPAPPEGLEVTGFRDHSIWRAADGLWYQIIGTGFKQGGGAALLYRSTNLRQWEYLHPLYSGDFDKVGIVWECPDFMALGDKHVLLISSTADRQAVYYIGNYNDYKFEPIHEVRRLDYGGYLYAPQTLEDAIGRRIMWGWIREGRSSQSQKAAGWTGVMSLPLLLSLQANNDLSLSFAPELQELRGKHYHLDNFEIEQEYLIEQAKGDCLEIIIEFEPAEAAEFGFGLRCSPDNSEQTLLGYKPLQESLTLDCAQSSLDKEVNQPVQSGKHKLETGEGLKLHLFLDRSVIEICANNQSYFTGRVYPTRTDSQGLKLFAQAGRVKVKSLNIWELKSIWQN